MLVGPEDTVFGAGGSPDGASVLEFWRWCFADLSDDDVKGWYAEWLVGLLLGLPMTRRYSWAENDHVTPEGVRIEVKASAYWQSWKIVNTDGTMKVVESVPDTHATKIAFGNIRGKNATSYKADLYIFAFHSERDPALWNALDTSKWEFYALTCDQITAINTQSISLTKLRLHCPAMSASEFRVGGRALVKKLAEQRQSRANPLE